MTLRARLVPELLVTDLAQSLKFWCEILGFRVMYDRPEDGFTYLDFDGAEVMLEQLNAGARQWVTDTLVRPLGRGVNFQIDVQRVDPIVERLNVVGWPLFMDVEERWYRAQGAKLGVRQFLVQDPDGYLVRLAEQLDESSYQQRLS